MAEFPLFHFERVPIRDQTSQQLRQDTEINIDLNMNLDKKKLQKKLNKKDFEESDDDFEIFEK